MCTAISCQNLYFGRNLDLERGYGEQVVITPRRFLLPMRCAQPLTRHYAMIGMAAVEDGFPLYFEATNEKGLSMAGLNFPGNAVYHPFDHSKENITAFELIPWVLGKCADADEARQAISEINLVNIRFSEQLPLSPLHWMISDREQSIVVESVEEGIRVYENPFQVLTNNPTFDYHKVNMSNFMGLHVGPAKSCFREALPLQNFSLGMGALGLPGDFSSQSRFARAVFVKENAVWSEIEQENVNQFFHILDSVFMPKGCVWTKNGFEYTRYSSCCNIEQGIYYYKTYNDFAIKSVHMHAADLEQSELYTYEAAGLA